MCHPANGLYDGYARLGQTNMLICPTITAMPATANASQNLLSAVHSSDHGIHIEQAPWRKHSCVCWAQFQLPTVFTNWGLDMGLY